jgi:protein subunit release factor B
MGLFPVSETKERNLLEKMAALGLREEDIEESFVRSRGPGGQRLNKVSTCVQLRHRPTGLEVRCQKERAQAMNRYHARVLLARKMDTLIRGRESEERQRIEKLRRQKRKRSRRAKEKVLAEKHRQSEKKRLRARPGLDNG